MKIDTIKVVVKILLLSSSSNTFAFDLDTKLSESGWDRIIGTWEDIRTSGSEISLDYQWLYKNKVIKIISREGKKETTALMALNPKSGDVFSMATDNQGGSSVGKWEISKDQAVLGILFVTGEGKEGALEITHKLENDDTMYVSLALPKPISFQLVRTNKK
ncbi:MAG: hypothetical protein VXZ83_05160 [Verrucomicrobiota bacterium]|nr:hypothetical protein [Verrucomicrobiota bacterium]